MSLESDLFGYLRPYRKKLEKFGFQKQEGIYRYQRELMGGDFIAEVDVDQTGEVSGKVMDAFTGDVFVQMRLENDLGAYSGKVREAYLNLLEEIAKACFHPVLFRSNQANRITERMEKTWGDKPDHPFEKYPGFTVYRLPQNEKWYVLVMNVDRSHFESGEGEINVMNLKVDPEQIDEYLKKDGIYPAYHSNKKHWVSILLDERIPDDELFAMIQKSRDLISGKKAKASGDRWIIPANPKYYDLIGAFRRSDVITWHQSTAMKPGDIVYIYYAAPYSCLLYACVVLEADLPNPYSWNPRFKKMVKLRRIHTFPKGLFPITWMKEHGVAYVRSTRTCPSTLSDAIEAVLVEG